MVQSKKLIPEIYSQSYDLSIFTGLIDLIYTSRDVDILRIKNAHAPYRTFKEDLVSLASSFSLGETQNRDLISLYRCMIQLKGTLPVIEAAICFVSSLSAKENTVETQKEEFILPSYPGHRYLCITLYSDFNSFQTTLLEKLLDRLAPVNVFVSFRPIGENSILVYSLSDDGSYYIVTGVGGKVVSSLTIPDYYDGLPVTTIASRAFSGNTDITSVTIGSNVTTIGSYAFYNCSKLTSIIFKDSTDWQLTIATKGYAFDVSVTQDSEGDINAVMLTTVNDNNGYANYTWTKKGELYYIWYFETLTTDLVEYVETVTKSYLANSLLSSISFPELSVSGYTFLGWFDSTEVRCSGLFTVTASKTLYSKWAKCDDEGIWTAYLYRATPLTGTGLVYYIQDSDGEWTAATASLLGSFTSNSEFLIQLVASEGYSLPADIAVSEASYTYEDGIITITNPTYTKVVITAAGVLQS